MGLKGVTVKSDFEELGYSTGNKIFATLTITQTLGCVKLSTPSQEDFCRPDMDIYPVPNSWKKKAGLLLIPAKSGRHCW